MSTPMVTFRDMMVQFAASADRAYDMQASPTIDELNTNLKSKFAAWASSAIERLWRNPNPAFAWKWTTTSATVTLQSNGSFLYSDIEESDDWFSCWSSDPRPVQSNPPTTGWFVGNSAYPVRCVEDAAGVWPRIAQSTVFVFYRTPFPKFTSRLVDTGATYNTIGTLVWDETASGSVYKSIATGALGNALTNTAKWTPQDIPSRLANILEIIVEAMRLQATGADGSSTLADREAQTWLDYEMAKENPRDGSGPPWGYDRRFINYSGYPIPFL